MGMVDDLLRLCWMTAVVLHAFFEVAEVVLEGDVMVVWNESAFHVPGLTGGAWHHGNGIGGHDPLQIRGYIVAFQTHDVLVIQMLSYALSRGGPFWMFLQGFYDATVAHTTAKVQLHELATLTAQPYLSSENGLIAFLLKRFGVFHKLEMAVLIELQQDTVGMVLMQQPTLYQGWEGGGEIDIAWHIAHFMGLTEIACHGHEVKVIGGMEGGIMVMLQRIKKDVVVSVMLMHDNVGQGGISVQLVVIAYTVGYLFPICTLTRTSQQFTGTVPKEEGWPIQIDDFLYVIR